MKIITSHRDRGGNDMFSAIAESTAPSRPWKSVDVLADFDGGGDSFAARCEQDQSLADDWSEYQASGLFDRATGKGVGAIGVLNLAANGAPIPADGLAAAVRAACASGNPVVAAAGREAASRYGVTA
ncbi:MAG: hypothetical protein CO066_02785 [Comamonadaceae bacterium CG_4_9_14_0_8_um_filter_60_18]|nr:MAG: hypothetical protein CO066_02785 [Comamonadaceae bacterium CG_4_9_14_0_8_um_filter_60_18]